MKTAAIIAEYNPFHNGHAFHIAQTRSLGYNCIVAVLGGNFTQRGEVSSFPKDVKCRAALLGGADLVVELPTVYSLATAERFAFGAVNIIGSMGCVDAVSFGSECGDISQLEKAVNALSDERIDAVITGHLQSGISYAAARAKAVKELYGTDTSNLLETPNNILAVEYMRRLKSYPDIKPVAIKRRGEHDSSLPYSDRVASASHIRSLISDGKIENALEYVPEQIKSTYLSAISEGKAVCDIKRIEPAILAKLRCMGISDFAKLPDVSEGLENRLYASARNSGSLDEFYSSVKTKRYALSRIRRITMHAFLGITEDTQQIFPPYIRILGFNKVGESLIRKMKTRAALPLSSSLFQLSKLQGNASLIAQLEERYGNLFYLSMPHPYRCGSEYTYKIQKI